jgi:hypothetical protein
MAKTKARRKPAPKRRRNRSAPAPKKADQSLTASETSSGPGDKLTDEQQTVVVQRLAMFDTPSQVADFVREEFGVEITRQSIHYYDPTHGDKPAEKWVQIFNATRTAFLESTADIPIANKSVRLRRIERMALAAEKSRNYALAAQLHEQAAKEVGEVFTNRLKAEHTGRDGEPIEVVTNELRNKLTRRIAGIAARVGPPSNHSGSVSNGARSA